MSFPPCLMRLKIINQDHRINLWLPVFLVWILLGALAIILTPLVLLLVLLLWPWGWGKLLWNLGPTLYCCVCSLRDLKIDVNQNREMVLIYFI